ncbi:MAG: ABC transporter substrate-binding protein [Carbonactinosporaceae bacterium]
MRGKRGPLLAMTGALTLVLAACGGGGGGGGGAAGGNPVVVGTTDKVVSFDPAGSYDLGSWTIVYNTYQTLMTFEPGGNEPVPDAAESCDFTDEKNTTYVCTLKEGLKFSDGSPLTSEDVVFSFQRVIDIEDPNGPSTLIADMKSVEATGDLEVTFELKAPTAVWPFIVATPAGAIVPSDAYPADAKQPNTKVIGSGPYKLASYEPGQRAVLEPHDAYKGPGEVANDGAIMTYFDQPSALKLAIEQAEIDVAYRSLSPTDIADLRETEGVEVVDGEGTEIRYIVFNLKQQPGNEQAVRQAMAMLVDRQAIAENVYSGTVDPLYSMVPQGLQYATKSFADRYGTAPDPEGAKQVLQKAGVKTPVPVELWWTPSHYGPVSADEYTEVKRQLEDSGLFKVTLKSSEWQQYSVAYSEDQYPVFQLGWFPDYPDAHDYTAPFFQDGGFFNNHYKNEEINKLLAEEAASVDPQVREQAFAKIQDIAAEEVPTIPLWQGKQVGAVQQGVKGVADTFDATFIFRMYMISKPSE